MPEIVNSGENLSKVCPKCSKLLPATTEYFYRRTRRNGRTYLSSGCKTCIKVERRTYCAGNPEKVRETNAMSRERNGHKYNQQRRQKLASNPDLRQKMRLACRDWYRKNHEYALLQKRAYVAENKEKVKECNLRSRLKNPGRIKAHNVNRKALVRKAQGKLTKADISQQFEHQNRQCYWCKSSLKDHTFHVDHLVPISRGGAHDPGNIVISCQTCNLSKGAKTPDEFVEHLKFVEANRDFVEKLRMRMRESMRKHRAKKPGQCRA